MTIEVDRIGRRSYLRGNTYAIKDALRAAGAHWDAEQRAWWIGSDAKARELAGQASAAQPAEGQEREREQLSDDARLAGKARYRKGLYLLLWEGETKRGPAAKLATVDGAKVFWVPGGEYEVLKRYAPREYRGRLEPFTFGAYRRFVAKVKRQADGDSPYEGARYVCEECGEWVTRGQGSCWETGAAH